MCRGDGEGGDGWWVAVVVVVLFVSQRAASQRDEQHGRLEARAVRWPMMMRVCAAVTLTLSAAT
jgi:hypothetical protein